MRSGRSVLGLGILAGAALGALDPEVLNSDVLKDDNCNYGLEIMLLQDGSMSFDPLIDEMKGMIGGLLDSLKSTFGEFSFGLSSFVDKPVPDRGYGPYAGYQHSPYVMDYCYALFQPVTFNVNKDDIIKGIDDLWWNLGSGGDFPEGSLEGLLRLAADSTSGFSPPEKTHDHLGRPIVRVAILVTDDMSHLPNDTYKGTWHYNNPRHIEPTPEFPNPAAIEGWGSPSFLKYVYTTSNEDKEAYQYMSALLDIADGYNNATGGLTAEQEQELDQLVQRFGPSYWPWPAPHPGDDSMPCESVEYPSIEQVGDILNKKQIFPVFLTGQNSAKGPELRAMCKELNIPFGSECLAVIYKRYGEKLGVPSVTAAITMGDAQDVFDRIVESLVSLVERVCYPPTTPAPTLPPTTQGRNPGLPGVTLANPTTQGRDGGMPNASLPTQGREPGLPEATALDQTTQGRDGGMPNASLPTQGRDPGLPEATVLDQTTQGRDGGMPNASLPTQGREPGLPEATALDQTTQGRDAGMPNASLPTQGRDPGVPEATALGYTTQGRDGGMPDATLPTQGRNPGLPEATVFEQSTQGRDGGMPDASLPTQGRNPGLPEATALDQTTQGRDGEVPEASLPTQARNPGLPEASGIIQTTQGRDVDLPNASAPGQTTQGWNIDIPSALYQTTQGMDNNMPSVPAPDFTQSEPEASVPAQESTDDIYTTASADFSHTTTTTAGAAGGPPIGVIVGSAAGGLGAIAAGALWGKAALAGITKSVGPTMTGAEQVEVPEQAVERETMEEVTMDMFQ